MFMLFNRGDFHEVIFSSAGLRFVFNNSVISNVMRDLLKGFLSRVLGNEMTGDSWQTG